VAVSTSLLFLATNPTLFLSLMIDASIILSLLPMIGAAGSSSVPSFFLSSAFRSHIDT